MRTSCTYPQTFKRSTFYIIFLVKLYFTGKHTLTSSVLPIVLQCVPDVTIKIHIGIVLMPSLPSLWTVDCAKRTPSCSHFPQNNVLEPIIGLSSCEDAVPVFSIVSMVHMYMTTKHLLPWLYWFTIPQYKI